MHFEMSFQLALLFLRSSFYEGPLVVASRCDSPSKLGLVSFIFEATFGTLTLTLTMLLAAFPDNDFWAFAEALLSHRTASVPRRAYIVATPSLGTFRRLAQSKHSEDLLRA